MRRIASSIALSLSTIAISQSAETARYAQLVLPLQSPRVFVSRHDARENALVLHIAGTAPSELEAINHYDERLIRRVLIKDLGQAGTELSLILRDSRVRATIMQFDEPFRIVIDLFDRGYQEQRDPVSGLPLLRLGAETVVAKEAASPASTGQFVAAAEPDNKPSPNTPTTNQRRLLQPAPEEIQKPEDLLANINKIPEGLGTHWQDYPVYLYRLQTAPYKTGKSYKAWLAANTKRAMDSGEALADYAAKLFDFGHEGRALFVYQQLLYKAPSVFEHNPGAIWRLAECQLGQGNLILAEGYYQALIEKHQEDPLASFARLRLQDLKALPMLSGKAPQPMDSLIAPLELLNTKEQPELQAQIAIRKAYWTPSDTATQESLRAEKYKLPLLSAATRQSLSTSYQSLEGQRTAYLSASLILNDMLADDPSWSRDLAGFTAAYLKRYDGKGTEPFRASLIQKLQEHLQESIQKAEAERRYTDAIQIDESLPRGLEVIREQPRTAWAVGESYRALAQPGMAMAAYARAAKTAKEGPDRFRALFWQSKMAADAIQVLPRNNNSERQALNKSLQAADIRSLASWKGLASKEKSLLLSSLRTELEAAITHPVRLSTPPKIVLDAWTTVLSQAPSASGGEATDWQRNYSPSANTVRLLSDLATRFGELGKNEDRASAINLLRSLKPAQFGSDKAAAKLWADQLSGLADEYRQANKFLEAGRIYTLTGTEASDWDGRAEALYKGGLLLFRAGRREEALAAFKKASEDGNNLLYAELAQKRLNQLQR